MERKFDVTHRATGRRADDAWVLIPGRDFSAWVAARVYASICEPSLGRVLKQTLQETYDRGIVLGEQGRVNDPFSSGARLALRVFLAALEAIRNGQGAMIERVVRGITDRLVSRDAGVDDSDGVDDLLVERVRARLRSYGHGEVFTVEQVVRLVGGAVGPINSVLRGLADRHELVERFGEMTYRRR